MAQVGLIFHVVYKAPKDFPDNYVVRSTLVTATHPEPQPAPEATLYPLTDEGLARIREYAEEKGLTWLERQEADDPVILGCYI